MLRSTLLLTLALLIPTGVTAQEQIRVKDKVTVEPTALHALAYKMMEACTGQEGDFGAVEWSVARDISDMQGRGDIGGIWTQENGYPQIIIRRDLFFEFSTVSHEVLHDLYNGDAPLDVAQKCLLIWYNLTPSDSRDPQ